MLRYERRFIQRVAVRFRVQEVTGAMLYDEAFYIQVLNAWKADYQAIQKINDNVVACFENYLATYTKKDVRNVRLALNREQKSKNGAISDLYTGRTVLRYERRFIQRVAVRFRVQEVTGAMLYDEAVKELDRKVADAVKFYR